MVQPTSPPRNGFVRSARKIYNPIGFQKGYNFILWFIFAGALFGFMLARLQYLSFYGIFCHSHSGSANEAAPGECYYYTNFDRYKYGIIIHLATVLPAAFLVVFQFVPAIRHKFILYHRIAGYVILLLAFTTIASALVIADVSFGGELSTRGFIGFLAVVSALSLAMAYYNIKRLQIDQHRAWMLRAWFYMASIITLRIIFIIAASIISAYPNGFYTVWSCAKILYVEGDTETTYSMYPVCNPNNANYTVDAQAVVKANLNVGDAVNAGAALDISFGMAGILALFLHAIGIEIYLKLTPREAQRLRQVSYERQLERGMKNPGSAGLVIEKFGDADPWVPNARDKDNITEENGRNVTSGSLN